MPNSVIGLAVSSVSPIRMAMEVSTMEEYSVSFATNE